jgi:hypothetical protein
MALPPLPENNTDRLFIYYQTGGGTTSQEHVMTIRYDATLTDPGEIMTALGTAMQADVGGGHLFDGWQVLRAETQAKGSLFRFPVPVPGELLAVLGTGQEVASPTDQAREVRFQGRGTTSGRKVSLSLYGVIGAAMLETDFRFDPAASTLLGNLRALMQVRGAAGTSFINIGGGPTTWYTYVNWQYNSHWESQQRA